MTAIAGFNCSDGVVLAADTEESFGDRDKAYNYKLFPIVRPAWRLAVTGAGHAYLIDYAKEQIIKALETGGINTPDEFEHSLKVILDGLYRNEFSHYPVNVSSDLNIQLLVAAQLVSNLDSSIWWEPALFECQSNLVTKVKRRQGRVFGAGELLKELASGFAYWGLDAELAEWASIYLIHDAKRRYTGVGGRTHTFRMMDDGTYRDRPGKDVHLKEEVFETFNYIVQLLVLSLSPSLSDAKAKDLVDAAKKWVSGARLDIKQMEVEREKLRHNRITINSREMQKLMRKLRNPIRIKLSASQKSEPEP